MKHNMLSAKALDVLQLISEGYSYDQILSKRQGLTYFDIFNAAHEALTIASGGDDSYDARMADIRSAHLRAYEKWTAEEDTQLSQKYRAGLRVNELAKLFARQPGAIESRLRKLGLAT